MKMIKFALLGTAALAAVSVSARASELSDLKAQIEALNARVSATEAQAAVPAGFSLLQVGKAAAIVVPGLGVDKDYGTTATQIGIVPAADMPAATVIQWAGYVRAALTYQDRANWLGNGDDATSIDVKFRTELKVTGKTDTAVGEVGATVKLRAEMANDLFNSNYGTNRTASTTATFFSPGAWGWWKMTPELTLGGGLDGSLAGNGYGYDGACTCMYTDKAAAGYGHDGDPTQLRLSYASGPMSAAIAVEDYYNYYSYSSSNSSFGFAGEVKYAGDTVSGELSAGYWDPADSYSDAAYVVDLGLGFALSDMFNISAAAGMGSGHGSNDDFWKASILATANLSDSARVEVGYSYNNPEGSNNNQNAVMAGIYYAPVSQLTIGLEAEYLNEESGSDRTYADFVTKFSF